MHAAVGLDRQHAYRQPARAHHAVGALGAARMDHRIAVDRHPIVLEGAREALDGPGIAVFFPDIAHPLCLAPHTHRRHGDDMVLPLSVIPAAPRENEPANAAKESAETLALLA